MRASLRSATAAIARAESALRDGTRRRVDAAVGPITRAALALADEVRLAWVARSGARRLRRLVSGHGGLRVHLGSGADVRSGWVNIDLSLNFTPTPLPTSEDGRRTVYVNHDIRRGLPLPSESCEIIYSSHFFEHLDRRDGYRVMREAYRALQPGGIFRVVIPDFRACFEAYVRNDTDYFSLIDLDALFPGTEARPLTPVDYLNYAVYQFGEHRCLYDEEKLRALLTGIGFHSVERTDYNPKVDVDSELRTRYSLYMHARR
jgi:predicted SAM-dependent methyltransferase